MPVYKDLRVKTGYTKTPHHEFCNFLLALYRNLLNNPHFPKPTVDLALFKEKIDAYFKAISATMGGAKLAFNQRDSLRYELEGMFKLLAAYVQYASNGDYAIFQTSGLEAQPNAQVPPQPFERPRNPKVAHGDRSGELKVWMPTSRRKIASCDLQYVAVDEGHMPAGAWTEIAIARFDGPVTIQDLKPGTRYAVQVRALGKLGKTDWSDSTVKMCV